MPRQLPSRALVKALRPVWQARVIQNNLMSDAQPLITSSYNAERGGRGVSRPSNERFDHVAEHFLRELGVLRSSTQAADETAI